MNKKYISLITIIILVTLGGYFLMQNNNSEQNAISRIASTTENQIDGYTTSTRKTLQYELQDRELTSPAEGATIDQLGLSFEIPWGNPVSTDDRGDMVGVNFAGNKSLVITKQTGSPQQALRNIDSDLSPVSKSSLELFEQELGNNFSGYDFMKYIFSVKPGDIRDSKTIEEAARKSYALSMRATMPPTGQPYSFSENSKKGFVFVGGSSSHIQVWLGGESYSVILSGGMSKETVDTVIQTLERKNSSSNSDDSSNYFSE